MDKVTKGKVIYSCDLAIKSNGYVWHHVGDDGITICRMHNPDANLTSSGDDWALGQHKPDQHKGNYCKKCFPDPEFIVVQATRVS